MRAAALLLAAALPAAAALSDAYVDYETVPFGPVYNGTGPALTTWSWNASGSAGPYTAHAALIADPRTFSFELYPDGCVNPRNTSQQVLHFDCDFGTNAGFFALIPAQCLGIVVMNGTIKQNLAPGRNSTASLGMGPDSAVIGFFDEASVNKVVAPPPTDAGVTNMVSGLGWIVRNGVNYANSSHDIRPNATFDGEIAPRIALCLLTNGSMAIVAVDGVKYKVGLPLYEFADLLLATLPVRQAVNMDGGGSADMVLVDKAAGTWRIINRPTCADTWLPVCEREVTSTTCVRLPPGAKQQHLGHTQTQLGRGVGAGGAAELRAVTGSGHLRA